LEGPETDAEARGEAKRPTPVDCRAGGSQVAVEAAKIGVMVVIGQARDAVMGWPGVH